ncbi:MAG: hypothetical protein ABIA02_02665 [Candidatus Falkowbacteria bacterium]
MPKKILKSKKSKESLDHVYNNEEIDDLQKINMPSIMKINDGVVKRAILVIAIILVCFIFYVTFLKHEPKEELTVDNSWYTVKLVDGKVYYGQISDLSADPVVLESVYYNYDQIKVENGEEEIKNEESETGNIRLVKRGKETHGPTGTMNVVRAQVLYMEPLAENSKVLKAILEYEK